jgi:transcriptional regulator of acetoin/glycerol metabolism
MVWRGRARSHEATSSSSGAHLPPVVRAALSGEAADGEPADDASTEGERLRAQLEALLREHAGNVAEVARAMGKARMQIHRWLKRFDIDPDRYRR